MAVWCKPALVRGRSRHRAFAVSGAALSLLVLAALIVCWMMVDRAQEQGNECVTVSVPLAQRRMEVVWLDEVLTMSTTVAALSGQARWVERYNEHVQLLDNALAALDRLLPAAVSAVTAQKTSAANDKLVAMERDAHAAVLANDTAAAQAIVLGAEYAMQKALYADGYRTTEEYIAGRLSSMRSTREQAVTGGAAALGAGSVLLICSVAGTLLLWYDNRQLAEDMVGTATRCAEAIADMRLEQQLADFERDPLPEHIQAPFRRIIDTLLLYRTFLPRSILARDPSDYLEDDIKPTSPMVPPSGNLALCFTDIIGSTALWEASPESMEKALMLHNREVRRAIADHKGYEVKTIGDSFMVAFQETVPAVLFGLQVQEALLSAKWPEDAALAAASPYWNKCTDASGALLWHGLAVRIGIAAGEAREELSPVTGRIDYRGPTVNLAARCESGAPHGTVCVSESVYESHQDPQLQGFQFVAQPPKKFKGIGGLTPTYVVTSPQLQARLTLIPAPTVASPLVVPAASPNPLSPMSPGRRLISVRRCSQGSADRGTSGSYSSSGNLSLELRSVASQPRFGTRIHQVAGAVATVAPLDGGRSALGALQQQAEHGAVVLTQRLNTTLQQCTVCATRTQGKVEVVVGATVCVSWNVTSHCPNYQAQSVAFARFLTAVCQGVRVGLSSGDLYEGNIGVSQRFHSVLGLAAWTADEICRFAGVLGARVLLAFIPEPPHGPAVGAMRPVDVWRLQGAGGGGGSEVMLPIMQLLLDDEETPDSLDCPGLDPLAVTGMHNDTYELNFWRAVEQGSAEAVERLAADAKEKSDAVGIAVAERLAEFVKTSPLGARALRDAPFQTTAEHLGVELSQPHAQLEDW
eukprot:TRINITY_DN109_c6_g1_i1.p1 TRINITY_DN109_c6_g1~~TRINITY_DN109_c6_g1_i1.p1  ORF type:complete len:866 (+),score=268.02 TRINITY_DN109_c6_g1_i1:99-2696(+)